MTSFIFTTVMVLGAYSAADLHWLPITSVPLLRPVSFDMHSLLMMTALDAFNSFLYLLKNYRFSVWGLMQWLFLTKLFLAAHLVMTYDDRLVQIASSLLLTLAASHATACTISAIINKREELKTAKTVDLYVKMVLDVGF